jgi:excisionase family DNA binding protein
MKRFLSVREAAERAGVSGGLVRAWVTGGELAHYRLGKKGSKKGKIAIAPEDLEAFLRARRVEPAAATPPSAPKAGKGDDFASYYERVMSEVARKRRR